MTITFGNGQTMKFWFSYEDIVHPLFDPHERVKYVRTVRATVARCETAGRLYSATALCNPEDVFVKSKGRRIALARLLKVGLVEESGYRVPFNRDARTIVWEAYFRQHADLRPRKVAK